MGRPVDNNLEKILKIITPSNRTLNLFILFIFSYNHIYSCRPTIIPIIVTGPSVEPVLHVGILVYCEGNRPHVHPIMLHEKMREGGPEEGTINACVQA